MEGRVPSLRVSSSPTWSSSSSEAHGSESTLGVAVDLEVGRGETGVSLDVDRPVHPVSSFAEFDSSPRLQSDSLSASSSEADIQVHVTDMEQEIPASSSGLQLVHSQMQLMKLRDLHFEHRPRSDLIQFVKNDKSIILMDVSPDSIKDLLQQMLDAMVAAEGSYHEVDEAVSEETQNVLLMESMSVSQVARTIHGFQVNQDGQSSFSVMLHESTRLRHRHAAFARLSRPSNFGFLDGHVQLAMLVLGPVREKGTKTVQETGRGFASFLSNSDLRFEILHATDKEHLRNVIRSFVDRMEKTSEQVLSDGPVQTEANKLKEESGLVCSGRCGVGMWADLKRCAPWYWSDFRDGLVGRHTLRKTVAASFFVYFMSALSAIAFGVLLDENTEGFLNVRKTLLSQMLGGLIHYFFGGQPMLVFLASAPLALLTKVIFQIAESSGIPFPPFLAWIGLWCALLLCLYGLLDVSSVMKLSSRSLEEIFGVFIAMAFIVDSFSALSRSFNADFYGCGSTCNREFPLFFVILLFGTASVGYLLWSLRRSVLLSSTARMLLSDYSLPCAVLLMSILGTLVFSPVNFPRFTSSSTRTDAGFELADLGALPTWAIFAAGGFGALLSFLIFMDHNITVALTQAPEVKLKKGASYHHDLFLLGISTALLAIFGLPWILAATPYCTLHARALSDVEDVYHEGHIREEIVRVRETRLAGILSHAAIGLSVLMIPVPLEYIPVPVLYGVFLYLAVTGLAGNQFWERILLVFTEQQNYPPTHYVRRVPQRTVHLFTLFQALQCLVLCLVGFIPQPFLQMMVPLALVLLIPTRHFIGRRLFSKKVLDVFDG